MSRIEALLERLGVPERWGLRARIAEMLVQRAREIGPEKVAAILTELAEAVRGGVDDER